MADEPADEPADQPAHEAADPVVIVGAGLAGLACARHLRQAGVPVVVLEASDGVGGRVRSDVIDGFTVDRGFQLLNPAYPEAKRVLDLTALRLQPFPAAVAMSSGSGTSVVGDPRRAAGTVPASIAAMVTGRLGSPLQALRFARWALQAERTDVADIYAEPDTGWQEALVRNGIDGRLRKQVIEPFLAGVVGERDGETSHQFVQLLVRSFVRGRPAVPWRGMQALSDQLAVGTDVRLNTKAIAVQPNTVTTTDGTVKAGAVVVAAGPMTAAALLGHPEPAMRSLTTFWHVAAAPPTSQRALHVDGDRRGPVVNSVVMSNTATGYSPDQRALIATTILGADGRPATEQDVRAQLATMYRTATTGWELLTTHVIPHALTAAPPPLRPRQPVDLGDGLLVAGDHRDTSSIQGALVSGRRAAEAVLSKRAYRRSHV